MYATTGSESKGLLREFDPLIAPQQIANMIRRTRIGAENVKRLALLDVYGRLVALLRSLTPEQKAAWVYSPNA